MDNITLEHIVRSLANDEYWKNNRFIAVAAKRKTFKQIADILNVPEMGRYYIFDHALLASFDGSLVFVIGDIQSDKISEFERRNPVIRLDINDFYWSPPAAPIDASKDVYESAIRKARMEHKQKIWSMIAEKILESKADDQ